MLGKYNEIALSGIDVLNENVRTGLTGASAESCFAPAHGVAAQRKSLESVHIYFTVAAIFRAGDFTRKRTHSGSPDGSRGRLRPPPTPPRGARLGMR